MQRRPDRRRPQRLRLHLRHATSQPAVTDTWNNSIVNGKLPTTLDGVSVNVGGTAGLRLLHQPHADQRAGAECRHRQRAGHRHDFRGQPAPPSPSTRSRTARPSSSGRNGQPVATHADFTWAVKNGTFAGVTTVPAKPGEVHHPLGHRLRPHQPRRAAGVAIPVRPVRPTTPPARSPSPSAERQRAVYGDGAGAGLRRRLYQVVVPVPASAGQWRLPAGGDHQRSPSPTVTLTGAQLIAAAGSPAVTIARWSNSRSNSTSSRSGASSPSAN